MATHAEQIIAIADQLQVEETKAAKGNKSSVARARKLCMEIKKLCATARVDLQATKGQKTA